MKAPPRVLCSVGTALWFSNELQSENSPPMNPVLRAARKLLSDNVLAQFEYLGQIEYHLRPNLGEVWGGPFNGQWNRQRIVTDLIRTFQPSAIVETGTFRGASTLFFALNSQVPIYSTEANRRFYGFAARRLRHWPKVTLIRQDSRAFLKTLDFLKDRPVFFYLDAHSEVRSSSRGNRNNFGKISEFLDNDRRLQGSRGFRIWLRRLWTRENARSKGFSVSRGPANVGILSYLSIGSGHGH